MSRGMLQATLSVTELRLPSNNTEPLAGWNPAPAPAGAPGAEKLESELFCSFDSLSLEIGTNDSLNLALRDPQADSDGGAGPGV